MARSLVGNDRPGIVRAISHVLAKRGVNVEDLQTDCVPAPVSGVSLFKVNALLKLNERTAAEFSALQSALEILPDGLILKFGPVNELRN